MSYTVHVHTHVTIRNTCTRCTIYNDNIQHYQNDCDYYDLITHVQYINIV